MSYSVAIDGPAGAGKSTIAKLLAEKIGYIYIDTGAMYRGIALYLIRKDIDSEDVSAIEKVLDDIDITIQYKDNVQQVILNGENVNQYIRTPEVSMMTSNVSKHQIVREKLLSLQRDMAKKSNVLMDGRDIGTCVLPDANVKIYLTASSRTRAERRYKEMIEKGETCTLDDIEKDIIARDNQDMTRKVSPLKKADDAIEVDTSDMNIDEVVKALEDIINDKCQ